MRNSISRRDVFRAIGAASLAGAIARRGAAESSAGTALEPFNYSGVRLLDGMLRRQSLYARDFFLSIPDDNLLVGFRARAGLPAPGKSLAGWYGDDVFHAFGQYLSGMARLSKALGDAEIGAKAKRLMSEWAKTIEPDGYFYYSRKPNAPHYIYEKTMCGLVDLYEYLEVREAAPLMEKITGWADAHLERKTALGNEWYTLPENLYRAYELTGNSRYKTFGDAWRYPSYWGMFTREKPPDPFGFHAYSHVNTLSSCAMTYRVTGDEQYLKAIVKAFDWLEKTQMYATGGFGPAEKLLPPDGSLGRSLEISHDTFETVCGSWACFKLSRYLMTFTGKAFYGDWIEKLVYNGIGAALPIQADGSHFYYSDYTLGGGQKRYHPEKWACCSGTYPQSIADYHNLIYFKSADGLYVNLFVPSSVDWNHGGTEVRLEQDTEYPEAGATTVTVRPSRRESFALNFRVPRWAGSVTAEVNGKPADVVAKPGKWAEIRRTWSGGDRVQISIPMEPVFRPVDLQHPNRVAITYGPVVLVHEIDQLLAPGGRSAADMLQQTGRNLEFRTDKQRWSDTPFVPFYQPGYGEPYRMYFDLQA